MAALSRCDVEGSNVEMSSDFYYEGGGFRVWGWGNWDRDSYFKHPAARESHGDLGRQNLSDGTTARCRDGT